MASVPRDFTEGNYYHVYNRGHHKDIIFRDTSDRKYFLAKLDEFCDRDSIAIIAYCLLDNHFHLVLRQDGARPINKTMQSLLAGYVRAQNAKHGTVGTLFQGTYRAKLIRDEGYLIHLSRYIHLNPHPFADYHKYRWSSYRQYVMGSLGICDPGPVMDLFAGSKTSYAIYVEKGVSSKE